MIPISYSVRSLKVRKTNTIASAAGLALVVFVFSTVLMLAAGIKQSMKTSGREDTAILLRKGSDAELSSGIDLEQMNMASALSQVAKGPDGRALTVGEVFVVLAQPLAAHRERVSNLPVRGVPGSVWAFRPEAKIVAGRAATPGTDEAVIGQLIRGRFVGMDLGQTFELRKGRPITVVGVFSANGSNFESEVWADVDAVTSAFGRQGSVSSVRLRLTSAGQFDSLKKDIENDRRFTVTAMREQVYYEKQAGPLTLFITVMGMLIAIFFSAGAVIGAMITMYAAVDNRKREVGTLLALGFRRWNVLGAFLIESTCLSLLGGGTGALLALGMKWVTFSTMNMVSWSEITISFHPTVPILLGSLAFAAVMGVVGGFLPAIKAARMSPVVAMRD